MAITQNNNDYTYNFLGISFKRSQIINNSEQIERETVYKKIENLSRGILSSNSLDSKWHKLEFGKIMSATFTAGAVIILMIGIALAAFAGDPWPGIIAICIAGGVGVLSLPIYLIITNKFYKYAKEKIDNTTVHELIQRDISRRFTVY